MTGKWTPTVRDVRDAWQSYGRDWDYRKDGPLRLPFLPRLRVTDGVQDCSPDAAAAATLMIWVEPRAWDDGQGNRVTKLVACVPGTDLKDIVVQ